jgi:hypothetical protein
MSEGTTSCNSVFVPLVHHVGEFLSITAWAYREHDAPMVERNERLGFSMYDGKEVPSPPQIMAFPFDELARRFTGLVPEVQLLLANPAQP